jgi:hypothetical protein
MREMGDLGSVQIMPLRSHVSNLQSNGVKKFAYYSHRIFILTLLVPNDQPSFVK